MLIFSRSEVRVLSLDGGGSRGLVEAMVITKLEEALSREDLHGGVMPETPVKVSQVVDYIVGKKTWKRLQYETHCLW